MLCLCRPDVVIEPGHQRRVVGQAAHKRHGGMGMQVDEPGDKYVMWQNQLGYAGEAPACNARGQNRQNPAMVYDERMVFQHRPRRFDRNEPFRRDYMCCCHFKMNLVSCFAFNAAYFSHCRRDSTMNAVPHVHD